MQTVRIGVVGVGGMGSFHARTLASLAGVEVVAVADPHEPNALALHDELGCRAMTDPLALASADDIDGIVIASPDATHPALTVAALAQHTPVLCEKPIATTVDDARRVVETEVAVGRRLVQVGFMREYDPAHAQVRDELATVGAIDHIRAVHRNVNESRRTLDLIVGQSMVHDIHSIRFLSGAEVAAVHAFGSGPSDGSFRHVLAVCELTSGAHAEIEFDDGGFAYEVAVHVLGRHGDVLTGPALRPTVRREGSIVRHLGADWFGWFADAYRIQGQAWIDSIRKRSATGPTAVDGLAAQLVVEAIFESLTTGAAVRVPLVDTPALYRS